MLVCSVVVFASVWKGVNFQSNMVLATTLGLAVILLVLIGELMSKEKHMNFEVVEKAWAADWSKLGTVKIWRDAAS